MRKEEDDDDGERTKQEKTLLFMDLAEDLFPIDSWEQWEIRSLCRLGLLRYFGLENECDCNDCN